MSKPNTTIHHIKTQAYDLTLAAYWAAVADAHARHGWWAR